VEPAAVGAVVASGQGARVERLRRGLAPLLAFLAACLGVSCLLNLAQITLTMRDLSVVNGEFAGWAGAGACAGLCLTLVALLASTTGGAAVPLGLGAIAAVVGLALDQSVANGVQVAGALVALGTASGGLLGAAVCLPLVAPAPHRLLTVVAWSVPIVAGVPVLDELALSSRPTGALQIALHPPVWPLAAVCVLLVGWSALSLLLEGRDPPRGRSVTGADSQPGVAAQQGGRRQAREDPWTALVLAAGVPLVALTLLGFQPDVSRLWLRPLVIVVVAVAVLGLSVACFSMPSAHVRVGFAAVGIVLLCWPASIGVLLIATSRSAELSRVLIGVIVAAVALGAGLGTQWPTRGIGGGLLLLAAGAAGAWAAVPARQLLLLVPVAAMAGGAAAALLGGLRSGLVSPLTSRLVGAGAFSALTLGVELALPLSWALGGSLPVTPAAANADARVLLGLTFAATVLVAGFAATHNGRSAGTYN
jgi:hypothetical protein